MFNVRTLSAPSPNPSPTLSLPTQHLPRWKVQRTYENRLNAERFAGDSTKSARCFPLTLYWPKKEHVSPPHSDLFDQTCRRPPKKHTRTLSGMAPWTLRGTPHRRLSVCSCPQKRTGFRVQQVSLALAISNKRPQTNNTAKTTMMPQKWHQHKMCSCSRANRLH